jgi:class 3 adenylate cyclase
MHARDFRSTYPWPRNDGKQPYYEMLLAFPLSVSRAEIWPYLIDTSRLNRALGYGLRFETEEKGQLVVREKFAGLDLEWVEHPWQWLHESHAIMEREYRRGPFRFFRGVIHVVDNPRGGVTVWVQFSWTLKSRFFAWLLKLATPRFERKLSAVLERITTTIAQGRSAADNPYLVCTPITDPAATKRLSEIQSTLEKEKLDRVVVQTIVNYVRCGDDLDLHRIRPLKLARALRLDEQEVLRVFLHATRAGLFHLSWDITCPHCRGVRDENASLGAISRQGHCAVCDVDFATSGENAVEVTFRVHEAIRKTQKAAFCAAEPAKKAHIKWQQNLAPGEKSSALLHLKPGAYRLRDIVSKNKFLVDVSTGQPQELRWNISQDSNAAAKADVHFAISVRNDSLRGASFVFEELWWETESLRPGRLFCVPEYQQFFPGDALAAGVQLDLGNQTIFFSDVVGSTRFYREAGDSAAFNAIARHFDVLTAIVVRHGGSVIKTIGDAVMAAFHTPDDCLRACEEAQRTFSGGPLRLRISAHHGPVIAVNWNTGKDYFGNAVNFAAKMQACAGAGDLAVSTELLAQVRNTTVLKRYGVRLEKLEVAGVSADITVFDLNPAAARSRTRAA